MQRKQFLRSVIFGGYAMNSLSAFARFAGELKEQEQRMPVLFIGHGSPMNGIEHTTFSNYWK